MIKRVMFALMIGLATTLASAGELDATSNKITHSEAFWRLYTDALRGDKNAQFEVGVMYERGIGVDLNQFEAAKWYEKAAMQGHMDAQYNIGIMYASGRGVQQNDQFAMMWLASSAKQGDKESRKLLLALVDGTGTSNNTLAAGDNTVKQANTLIKPIRFEAREGASICTMASTNSKCSKLTKKQTFTSKEKQGDYYKISGVIVGHKWKDYETEGYIELSEVEIK